MNFDPHSYEASLVEIDTLLDEHHFLAKPKDNPEDPRLISWREHDY